jgi:hypothetical protein
MDFGEFLINEEKQHLGHRVSDILTGLQDIQNDMENLGSRHLARLADQITDEIRKVLHGTWGEKQTKSLKTLQRVGVALKKAIEDRDDLKEIIPTAAQELQTVLHKLGVRVNDLKAPEENTGQEVQPSDFEQSPEPQQPQQPQPDPQAPSADMGMAQ